MSEVTTEPKIDPNATADPNLVIKDEAASTSAPEPEAAPPAPEEPPKVETCELKAKGTFANGKGVMTADDGCIDLGRLQVFLVEQNGRTYEFSRISVR